MPALFTRISTGPNAASISPNAASTAAASPTSARTASASPPAASIAPLRLLGAVVVADVAARDAVAGRGELDGDGAADARATRR